MELKRLDDNKTLKEILARVKGGDEMARIEFLRAECLKKYIYKSIYRGFRQSYPPQNIIEGAFTDVLAMVNFYFFKYDKTKGTPHPSMWLKMRIKWAVWEVVSRNRTEYRRSKIDRSAISLDRTVWEKTLHDKIPSAYPEPVDEIARAEIQNFLPPNRKKSELLKSRGILLDRGYDLDTIAEVYKPTEKLKRKTVFLQSCPSIPRPPTKLERWLAEHAERLEREKQKRENTATDPYSPNFDPMAMLDDIPF